MFSERPKDIIVQYEPAKLRVRLFRETTGTKTVTGGVILKQISRFNCPRSDVSYDCGKDVKIRLKICGVNSVRRTFGNKAMKETQTMAIMTNL